MCSSDLVVARLGYRSADADNPSVQIIHRGKYKSLSDHEKMLLKRRQAIEPLIGHTKADHRMDRCWLQGAVGDALHALSCAAGYNIRWLLRAIARLAARRLFCALFERVLWVRIGGAGLASAWMRAGIFTAHGQRPVRQLPSFVLARDHCSRVGVNLKFAGPTLLSPPSKDQVVRTLFDLGMFRVQVPPSRQVDLDQGVGGFDTVA